MSSLLAGGERRAGKAGRMKRPHRDFQIVETHLFTRRKSIIGYLFILLDADEPGGRAMVYTDHLKHSHGGRFLLLPILWQRSTLAELPS